MGTKETMSRGTFFTPFPPGIQPNSLSAHSVLETLISNENRISLLTEATYPTVPDWG